MVEDSKNDKLEGKVIKIPTLIGYKINFEVPTLIRFGFMYNKVGQRRGICNSYIDDSNLVVINYFKIINKLQYI